MANCPRCRQELVENQVDEIVVRLCGPCQGILVSHADLVNILERSWRAVTPEAADKLEFHATDTLRTEPVFRCPDCSKPMEKYGYLGMAAIPIDRCDLCAVVWLDANELQGMVLALAKDNYRSEHARKQEWASRLELAHATMPPGGRVGGIWLLPDSNAATAAQIVWQVLRLLIR
jgi:Zn-finger nucleic acid-binding protein